VLGNQERIKDLADRCRELSADCDDLSQGVFHDTNYLLFPTARLIVGQLKADIGKNRERKSLGIDPGFSFLQKSIRALIPSHLWVVGGYTSHGKTALAVELIRRITKTSPESNVVVFSLEMSAASYILRLASNITRIPSLSILHGDHIDSVQQRIEDALEQISKIHVIIYDDLYEFQKISQQAQDIKNTIGVDVLFIDYIQNMAGQGGIYERMSTLAPQLQALAKELDCTIVALSQVSNEAINEDLKSINYKGAGEIAAACDLGLWLEKDRKDDTILRVAIRKNRHGPLGKAILRFKDNFTWLQEENENTRGPIWIEDG